MRNVRQNELQLRYTRVWENDSDFQRAEVFFPSFERLLKEIIFFDSFVCIGLNGRESEKLFFGTRFDGNKRSLKKATTPFITAEITTRTLKKSYPTF